ncbi:MAG: class I SAM-dependent methyltransferase [Panacibacter sp.]
MKPVSKTAYYCCGVRMLDADAKRPLVGDNYAKLLMGKEGMEYWQEFKGFKMPNASNIARHFIIDTEVKRLVVQEPNSTVIVIGAGFDSRAFRLPGSTWVEIDEPAIINYKNEMLPVDGCKNKLQRIAIDFEKEQLSEKLTPYAGKKNIIIILEGVLMYLDADAKENLLNTLTGLFPQHTLFCDIMSKYFFDKLGGKLHSHFARHGSTFKDLREVPEQLFLEHGYTKTNMVSTIKKASDAGILPIPKFLVTLLLKRFFMGYAVYHFTYHS